jgi:acetolactate synthase-1/2/3 large subunit
MHFLAALDRIGGIRCSLCLFEGVATGAADGYARMTGKPAVTLLHCGPGLANGLANLHNAQRAASPILNVVGDHARHHVALNSPLTSDVEAVAKTFSHWVRKVDDPGSLPQYTVDAIEAARTPPGRVSTLVLPADIAWEDGADPRAQEFDTTYAAVPDERISDALRILERKQPALFFVTGQALGESGLKALGRIAKASGAEFLARINNARIERGAGRVAIDRIPYPVDEALERLKHLEHIFLVGTDEPVAFFAYPDKPGKLAPPDCEVHLFARPEEDAASALHELADRLGAAPAGYTAAPYDPQPAPVGKLTPETLAAAIANVLPEDAVVCDESLTAGRSIMPMTKTALPHSWIQITGGAIGQGPPLALGAALACPDRKVLAVQADGSALYTVQALWTQARECADITTVILSNRGYQILKGEMRNIGISDPGSLAIDMMELDRPSIDWVSLAEGLGVDAAVADDAETLTKLVKRGLSASGPFLIEASLT